MGRYCENLNNMKDTGVLSTAILSVIGEDRYQDSWFRIKHSEIKDILFKMGELLENMQVINNGALSMEYITTKANGYTKMKVLMEWWYFNQHDSNLDFA